MLTKTERFALHENTMERFQGSAPENVANGERNQNTANKTRRDLHIVRKFISSKGDNRDIETIPSVELNMYLSELVVVIRRKDGKDFEPSSIRGILASIERYLRQRCTGISIFKDPVFSQTREAMRERFKQLTREGKGTKINAAFALSEEEINILYSKHLLGAVNADSLINTLWLNNCLHFGLRGCIKNRNMKWGDVILMIDDLGYEYLEYNEQQSNIQIGENINSISTMKPRIYGVPGSERDPIMIYKIYASKRPINYPDSPFYLAINVRSNKKGDFAWFKSSAMGVNKINSLMKTMAQKAGLFSSNGDHNKHPGRKYLEQKPPTCNYLPNVNIDQTVHYYSDLHQVNTGNELFNLNLADITSVATDIVDDSCAMMFSGNSIIQQYSTQNRSINSLLKGDDINAYLNSLYMNGCHNVFPGACM